MGLYELTKNAFVSRDEAQQVGLETFMEWDFVILFWGLGNLYKIWEFVVAANLYASLLQERVDLPQGSQATLPGPCCPHLDLQALFSTPATGFDIIEL